MNNKFMYRVLGALSSSMIIVSVFIPFLKVSGYSQSIWESLNGDFIFLPILIIFFGSIGILVFSMNKKTEFAYATSGAMIFYSVMRTIEIINQNLLNNLDVGYYFLIIGSILTGIMAYLCNIQLKENFDNIDMSQTSMNTGIDDMYQSSEIDNMSLNSNIDQLIDTQNLNSVPVQEIPLALNTIQGIPETESSIFTQSIVDNNQLSVPLEPIIQPVQEIITNDLNNQSGPQPQLNQLVDSISQINQVSVPLPSIDIQSAQETRIDDLNNQIEYQPQLNQPVDSISQINQQMIPQQSQFPDSYGQIQNSNISQINTNQQLNFEQLNNNQGSISNPGIAMVNIPDIPQFEYNSTNTIQQDFMNNNSFNINSSQNSSFSQNEANFVNQQNSSVISNEIDIFGQPINRN